MPRFLLLALVMSATIAQAQPGSESFAVIDERQTNIPAYFYHVLPGEATIQVYLWGVVSTPGAYVVAAQTDLEEILSLAGGPRLEVDRDEYIDEMFIRLYREQNGRRDMIYEATREEMIANPSVYPDLKSGDVIEVAAYQKRRTTFRDYLTLTGAVAAIGLTIERLVSSLSGE